MVHVVYSWVYWGPTRSWLGAQSAQDIYTVLRHQLETRRMSDIDPISHCAIYGFAKAGSGAQKSHRREVYMHDVSYAALSA